MPFDVYLIITLICLLIFFFTVSRMYVTVTYKKVEILHKRIKFYRWEWLCYIILLLIPILNILATLAWLMYIVGLCIDMLDYNKYREYYKLDYETFWPFHYNEEYKFYEEDYKVNFELFSRSFMQSKFMEKLKNFLNKPY